MHYWGERGLRTALFHDLHDQGLDGWQRFLASLELRQPFPAPERLQDVWAVLEPDFGERGFGRPDAIIKLSYRAADASKKRPDVLILFVDTTLLTYLRASQPERRHRRFHRSINGQLELNHRLALALEQFRPDMNADRLEEPGWVLEQPLYATPEPDAPRSTTQDVLLRELADPLGGFPASCYLHLAITSDVKCPWDAVPEEIQPVICEHPGQRVAWHDIVPRLLWTSWQRLERQTHVEGAPACPRFQQTSQTLRLIDRTGRDQESNRMEHVGVSLVRLRGQNSFVYLSWRDGNYRLRDYNGPQRIDLPHDEPLADVLGQVEAEVPVAVDRRAPYHRFEHWHKLTLQAKRLGSLEAAGEG